jgi:chromosome segregation ATPase
MADDPKKIEGKARSLKGKAKRVLSVIKAIANATKNKEKIRDLQRRAEQIKKEIDQRQDANNAMRRELAKYEGTTDSAVRKSVSGAKRELDDVDAKLCEARRELADLNAQLRKLS